MVLDAAGRQRVCAAVLGAFLADAATMPLHWIYDPAKVQSLLESKGKAAEPEFFPQPSCPFYDYALGRLSPYGDEAYALLQYAAAHPDVDGPGLTEHLVSFFKAYDGRLNGTAKKLVESWEGGARFPDAAAEDTQAHAIVKVPVLVARYGGTPQLAERVEAAVRSQQNSDVAVAMGQAAAAILERVVVQGSSVGEAIAWGMQPGNVPEAVREQVAPFLGDTTPSLHSMVHEITKAPSCTLPGALTNALYCAATSSGYVDNTRRNIVVGGDNCSRVLFGGALWAAAEGEGVLPEAWKQQVPLYPELERLVDELLSDLDGVLSSVRQLERRLPPGTVYPYIYLNDRPFTPEFKRAVTAAVDAPSFFGLVPREHWSYPKHINQTRAAELREAARRHMPYGGSESYRFMCRYFSGFFFDHPLLAGFDFYWRVEPDVHFTCNLERDPFRVLQQRNASLAWTIVMSEVPATIPSLWPTTQQWLAANPQHLAPNSLLPAFLEDGDDEAAGWGPFSLLRRWRSEQHSEDSGGGGEDGRQPWLTRQYTGCHFWSNFEIGRLSFFRSEAYRSFFEHLDDAGGFFYERWGDAPVHTLAAAALLDRSQVLWASDIGYKHGSWAHCPLDPESRSRCDCSPYYDTQPGRQPACQRDFLNRLAALEAAAASTSE
ncbi:hypothetical protein ABPG77_005633 [Micractinium sp. CCAP 211/92]